jgi:hypothetical protein
MSSTYFSRQIKSQDEYLNVLKQLERQKNQIRNNERKNIPLPVIPF